MANIGKKTKDNETKREKFVRLAEKRTDNALKNIDLLGNLANRSNYDYNSEDALKIIKALKSAISNLEIKFRSSNSRNGKFKL